MESILYVGRRDRFANAVSERVRAAGHEFVIARPSKAVFTLRAQHGFGVVVLCSNSESTTLAIAQTAKQFEIPVVVITSHLVRAFRTCSSFADIFLEKPASLQEVAILAIELANCTRTAQPAQTLVAATSV